MPMHVILAGYNIDRETLDEIKSGLNKWAEILDPDHLCGLDSEESRKALTALYDELKTLAGRDNLTPETISAAYARISRNPAPVNELRKIARDEVDKARKSNQNIIFGFGHSSVAEHAVFNFDVIGVSRYMVEEIEKFRLNAYTEKSQRYILLKDDYVIPEEIRNSPHLDLFKRTIEQQNEMYYKLYEKLLPYVFAMNQDLAKDEKEKSRLEGLAKEDARYALSMAVEAQLGMTVNARNAELMLSRAASHELAEVREFGRKLYNEVSQVAPSVIRHAESTEYFSELRHNVGQVSEEIFSKYLKEPVTTEGDHPFAGQDVRIWQFTPHPHVLIAASLLFSYGGRTMQDCINTAMQMKPEELLNLFKSAWRRMKSWDSVPREFENITIVYEVILSSSCFGQMKRHRMTTQVVQPYDPELDVTVPDSIQATGMEKDFRDLIDRVNDAYYTIRKDTPSAAPYILTNAHRRRLLLQVNARELYHISRLREDEHAQWDIRNIAHQMIELARKAVPIVFDFACGKDRFDERRKELFGN